MVSRVMSIGYLDFFKGEIGKTHLAQELWTQIDNGQLAPDLLKSGRPYGCQQ
ncbi:putative host specificity protein [Escherichia coli p0305293.7]|nr:putative host specificity protein [Escherichia coli p0305293.4]ENH55968.1 putative host specificity protein [Escherichia coli p0305293.7]